MNDKGHNDDYINFDEYIRQGEPGLKERADAWRVAIGLQAVDGLKTSPYLQETARRNIEGDISIDEVRNLVKQYYITRELRHSKVENNEEADKVSANISKLLQSDAFTFTPAGLVSIHRALFDGVFSHAGLFRTYNISKREWVLNGDSVLYSPWQELSTTIEYDLNQERQFSYKSLDNQEVVAHISRFAAGIWQIHPFCEGNTRTTAIFIIKYLRSMGFEVKNDLFENHSWYFRNALVRANYRNVRKGIDYETRFLNDFFGNLLLGETHKLRNRDMLVISPKTHNEGDSGQVQDKYRTSLRQVQDNLDISDSNIMKLVRSISVNILSTRQLMDALSLRGRDNFLKLYLYPALAGGFVRPLYPKTPRHPHQKYLLTEKGIALLKRID